VSNIIPFDFKGKNLRVVMVNETAFFVASDACDILEIGNVSMAVGRLDEDEKGLISIDTLGGMQEVWGVTESGLYSLALTSKKKEAKPFKRWLTHDVIPNIRKNGMYMTEKTSNDLLNDPTAFLAKAVLIAQEQIAKKEAELVAANERLEIAEPKAEAWTLAAEDEGFLLTAGEIAKAAALPGFNTPKVRQCAIELEILCKEKNEPTAHAIRSGLARLVIENIELGWSKKTVKVPKFRGKAMDMIVRHWKQKAGKLF
jgi:anti-repressor protein